MFVSWNIFAAVDAVSGGSSSEPNGVLALSGAPAGWMPLAPKLHQPVFTNPPGALVDRRCPLSTSSLLSQDRAPILRWFGSGSRPNVWRYHCWNHGWLVNAR